MKTLFALLLSFAIIVGAASTTQAQDGPNPICSSFSTCSTCVSPHANAECGWCSVPVTYGQTTGTQCAGWVPGKKFPFVCNGTFSIEQCQIGYKCDPATFQCVSAGEGQGIPLQTCQSECINNGTTYVCNKTSHQCEVATPGTPGATSLLVCQNQCQLHPTNTATATGSPNSHAPSPTETTSSGLFACNYTSGQCEPSVPGKGSSMEVCEQTCKKESTQYMCDVYTKQCKELPPGTSGVPLAVCENECNPTASPNPPPGFPLGLYRGLLIDNAYTTGVVYVDVQETSFTMVTMKNNQVVSYLEGTPTHINPSPSNEHADIMIIDLTAPASVAGKKLGTISDLSGLPGPETTFITMAYATAMDGSAPSSVTSSMTNSGDHVLALAKCQTPECKFSLPKLPSGQIYAAAFRHIFPHQVLVDAVKTTLKGTFTDHCSQYGTNCNLCISQPGCGWCSVRNVYVDGTIGTHCSGVNQGNNTNTTPWVCPALYHTTSCPQGYTCNKGNATCTVAAAGDGVPLQQCEAQCIITQTPAPPVKQYVCNMTTNQCSPCNETSCAGGMPEAQCEAACSKHKHGPPSALIGAWRGFPIQAGYEDIEIDYYFDNTSVTCYKAGVEAWKADVISFGNNAMFFTYTSGSTKGFKRGIYYQQSQEVPNDLYQAITVAEGKIGGPIPNSFPPPMTTTGEQALVFYKCGNAPCKFRQSP